MKTRPSPPVALRAATRKHARVLGNLLNLYMHDLSGTFAVKPGADGRFRYPKLPLYWSEPRRRRAFLIHAGHEVAGFALVTRGSPASEDPRALDVAEFFVLRGHRRHGFGREAAFALWNRVPGKWVVRVAEANRGGLAFWKAAVKEYARGRFLETRRPGTPHSWRVFEFSSVQKGRSESSPARRKKSRL